MRILGICGSLHAGSANLSLLKTAAGAAPAGVELIIGDLLRDLPLFNPELEQAGPPRRWRPGARPWPPPTPC